MILALLAGCLPEFADPTLLTELRVMSMVSLPPEAKVHEVVSVDTFVADPRGEGFDLLMWACASEVQCVWDVPEVHGDTATWTREVPPWAALEDLGTSEVQASIWALACVPGTCGPIEDARAGDPDYAVLADPLAMMHDLPLEGTSLARRTLLVTELATPLNDNPRVRDVPPPEVLQDVHANDRVDLDFWVSDDTDVTAEGYTTAGKMSSSQWSGHALTFTWTAPAFPGEADLWVLLEDGRGGAGVWQATVDVAQ